MACLYRTRDRNGKLHPVWRFKYRDASGKWRYSTGWADKTKTREHALALEAECRAIRKREKAAPASWLSKQHTPIGEVSAAYLAWGRTCGGRGGRPWDDFNAAQKERDLLWWTRELGLKALADIDMLRVEKAQQRLIESGRKYKGQNDRTTRAGLSNKTASLRVETLRALCCWAVDRGMLPENPLKGLRKLDTRPEVPHRALADDELAGLLAAAPPERRLWYTVAAQTGFRVDELRNLTVASLDRFGPSLFLAGDFTKNRKDARQPITRELAETLAALVVGKPPEADLLDIPRRPNAASELFKLDLDEAKIRPVTDEGRATWHSLRKCYDNALIRSGLDLKTVMTLMRHSSASLTLETYASADPKRLRAGAEAAAKHIKAAVSGTSCCTDVARKAATAGGEDASPRESEGLELARVVGNTGFEPVTSRV